jgi:hypothetical protein
MSIKKYSLFATLIVIVVIALALIKINHEMPDLSQKMRITSIKHPTINKTVYLKNLSRGLNFSINLISINNKNEISKADFYFDADKIFFKFVHDTLQVVTTSSYKQPTTLVFPFPIQCKQLLEAADFIKFKREYRYYGYSVFPKDELFQTKK